MTVKSISPLDVHKHLPKENCGKCGVSTCMGFAVKLLQKKARLGQCPQLSQAKHIQASMKLKEMLAPLFEAKETKLVIYENSCNGCGNCVIVCPPNLACSLEAAGGKGPTSDEVVMKMKNGVVIEMKLHSCRRFEEKGEGKAEPCVLCIEACPFEAIEFIT